MKSVWASREKQGFTIVELLIVVVVVAILAAITIVAYNGIQNRARQSSLQAAISQASKQVASYAPLNNDLYPADETTFFSTTKLADTSDMDYTYLVSPDRAHYCASVTNISNPSLSAAASDTSGGVVEGRCVRNLALDPSVTQTSSIVNIGSGAAPHTASIDTITYHDGGQSYRKLITGSGQSAGAIIPEGTTAYQVGSPVSWSFWVRSTRTGSIVPYLEGTRTANGSYFGSGGGASSSLPANQWVRVTGSITSLTTAIRLTRIGGYNTSLQDGDRIWYDSYMITSTPNLYEYADGDSAGWSWDGTPNASTSFGPAKRQ